MTHLLLRRTLRMILGLASLSLCANAYASKPETFSAVDAGAENAPASMTDQSGSEPEVVSQNLDEGSPAPEARPVVEASAPVAKTKKKSSHAKKAKHTASAAPQESDPVKQRLDQIEKDLRTIQSKAMTGQAGASGTAEAYDPVPSDQTGPITKRLKVIETLILKHGRAYDYRSHTAKELESILKKLDTAQGAANPSAAG
jgi:hypothetical protein